MNAKLLQTLLQQGHEVEINDPDSGKLTFVLYRNGEFFTGNYDKYPVDKDFVESLFSDYKITTPAPKLLKVGDKVEILEIARELPFERECNEHIDTMIKSKYAKITAVKPCAYSLMTENFGGADFPFHVVVKVEDK